MMCGFVSVQVDVCQKQCAGEENVEECVKECFPEKCLSQPTGDCEEKADQCASHCATTADVESESETTVDEQCFAECWGVECECKEAIALCAQECVAPGVDTADCLETCVPAECVGTGTTCAEKLGACQADCKDAENPRECAEKCYPQECVCHEELELCDLECKDVAHADECYSGCLSAECLSPPKTTDDPESEVTTATTKLTTATTKEATSATDSPLSCEEEIEACGVQCITADMAEPDTQCVELCVPAECKGEPSTTGSPLACAEMCAARCITDALCLEECLTDECELDTASASTSDECEYCEGMCADNGAEECVTDCRAEVTALCAEECGRLAEDVEGCANGCELSLCSTTCVAVFIRIICLYVCIFAVNCHEHDPHAWRRKLTFTLLYRLLWARG